jgi:hypothetical protein
MPWQVLGDIQFKFYHQWFDFIFILSALFFLAVFYTIDCSRQPSSLSTIKVSAPAQALVGQDENAKRACPVQAMEDKKGAEHFAAFHIH